MRAQYTFPLVLTAAAIACSTAPLGAQDPLVLVPVRASAGASDDSVPQPARRPLGRLWVAPLTVPPGAPLVATPEDGSYVRLADGTLWEVYLPDRTATVLWRRGDYIAVSRAAAGVNGYYDHELINAPARTRAYARFVGLVSRRR